MELGARTGTWAKSDTPVYAEAFLSLDTDVEIPVSFDRLEKLNLYATTLNSTGWGVDDMLLYGHFLKKNNGVYTIQFGRQDGSYAKVRYVSLENKNGLVLARTNSISPITGYLSQGSFWPVDFDEIPGKQMIPKLYMLNKIIISSEVV